MLKNAAESHRVNVFLLNGYYLKIEWQRMCVTFGIVHFPCNYHRQINFFPTNDTNIWFTEVLVHVSATTFSHPQGATVFKDMWSDNKTRELIKVKVLRTSLLNTTMVAFKVLPLGSYAPMPAPSPPFKTILQLVLWNGLQSCHFITPDVINVIKMPSFQYSLYLREQKKVSGG